MPLANRHQRLCVCQRPDAMGSWTQPVRYTSLTQLGVDLSKAALEPMPQGDTTPSRRKNGAGCAGRTRSASSLTPQKSPSEDDAHDDAVHLCPRSVSVLPSHLA